MKHMKTITVAGCSLLLLTQCASQDDVRDLQYQLRAVNQKVEDVRNNAVDQMQKRQASSVSKIDQVEGETLRIRSTIEETTAQTTQFRDETRENIAGLQTSLAALRTEQDAKLAEMNQKIAILEEKITQVTESFSKAQQTRINEA